MTPASSSLKGEILSWPLYLHITASGTNFPTMETCVYHVTLLYVQTLSPITGVPPTTPHHCPPNEHQICFSLTALPQWVPSAHNVPHISAPVFKSVVSSKSHSSAATVCVHTSAPSTHTCSWTTFILGAGSWLLSHLANELQGLTCLWAEALQHWFDLEIGTYVYTADTALTKLSPQPSSAAPSKKFYLMIFAGRDLFPLRGPGNAFGHL